MAAICCAAAVRVNRDPAAGLVLGSRHV